MTRDVAKINIRDEVGNSPESVAGCLPGFEADTANPLLGSRYKLGHLPASELGPGFRDGAKQETPAIRPRRAGAEQDHARA